MMVCRIESANLSYDALSRRTQLTRVNGLNTIYSYDSLSRLLSVQHQQGGKTLDGASYTYDVAGNRTSRTPLPGKTAQNFSYDAIYQLAGVTQGHTTNESYTYDAVGNRLSALGVSPYTYNSSNELTAQPGITYTYDSNGNQSTKVSSAGTTTFTWDFENRLVSVAAPGVSLVSFKYDPFGWRIHKSSSSGINIHIYYGEDLIEEVDSSGSAVDFATLIWPTLRF